MNNKVFITSIFFFVTFFLTACQSGNTGNVDPEEFISSITFSLQNKSGKFSLKIPEGVDGYLVMAAPYAIADIEQLKIFGFSDRLSKQIISLSQDNSVFHLLLIHRDSIIIHEKWSSPPVVFNDYFCVSLTKKNLVTFSVEDKVLKKVTVN